MRTTLTVLQREIDSFRLYLQSLHSIRIGRFYDVTLAFFYTAFCAVYIVNTAYLENSPAALDKLELSLAALFLFSWLMELFASSSRLRFFISPRSFCVLFAIIPVFATVNDQNSYVGGGSFFPYVYPCRFMAFYVMVASCLVRGDESLLRVSQLQLSIIRLLLGIVFLILTTAAFMQIIVIKSAQVATLNFFESFFYTVIVLFTVGYLDDVLPDAAFARIVILIAIMFGAVYIPAKVADIYQLMQEQSAFGGNFAGFSQEELRDGYSHVVVCGVWRSGHLRNFARRLLALGGGKEMARAKVVVLGALEPDEEMLNLLQDPLYVHRVVYLKGSVLHVPDCERACLGKAKAVFILSDNHKASPNRMDAEVIMRAVAVHHFDPMSRILVKLQMPQNLFHLTWGGVEQVVCVHELKMGLMSHSCLCPGYSTLMYAICCPYIDAGKKHVGQREAEFTYGAQQELYIVPAPDSFQDRRFASVALLIYQHFAAVLLAVAVPCGEDGEGRLDFLINPSRHVFTGHEQMIILARSSAVADCIADLELGRELQVTVAVAAASGDITEDTPLVAKASGKADEADGRGRAQSLRGQRAGSAASLAVRQVPARNVGAKHQALVCDPVMGRSTRAFIKQLVDTDFTRRGKKDGDETDGRVAMTWEFLCSGKPKHISLSGRPWMLRDHIVLCDNSDAFPRNLGFFMAPLRTPYLEKVIPVVVLNPSLPSYDQWKLLSSFAEVYFVQGSPLEPGDLKRAAISSAARVVVLSDSTMDDLADPEHTVDAISLLAAHNIHFLAKPTCFTINELVQSSNMDLLIPQHSVYFHSGKPSNHGKDELSLPFMSGRAFSSTMLDSLLCSAHTNPLLLSFVRMLLFAGCDDDDDDEKDGGDGGGGGADGGGVGGSVDEEDAGTRELGAQLSRSFEKPGSNVAGPAAWYDGRAGSRTQQHLLQAHTSRPGSRSAAMELNSDVVEDVDKDTSSGVMPQRVIDPHDLFDESPIYREQCLHSLPKVHLNLKEANNIVQEQIPGHFSGSTYGKVFHHYVTSQSSVALGLWRLAPDRLHYVATNPSPSTILRRDDFVFLLKASGTIPVSDSH